MFAFERTACTQNQFVSHVVSRLPSKVQFIPANVPTQNIIIFEDLETSPTTVPHATGVDIDACTAVISQIISGYDAGFVATFSLHSSSSLNTVYSQFWAVGASESILNHNMATPLSPLVCGESSECTAD